MIKVLQFGDGNFLRGFADAYFNCLCEEGYDYDITLVRARFGSVEKYRESGCAYHLVLRGVDNGRAIESVHKINVIKRALDPLDNDIDEYLRLASDSDLKIIISNTTESGISFNECDSIENLKNSTFPAKLACFLHERFLSGCQGVYILPTELIDNNGDKLFECVERYSYLFDFSDSFRTWNREQNYYCNTLVDRIVSGYPRDEETLARMEALIGTKDELMTVAEPFGLWAIEKKGEINKYIVEGNHNISVALTDDIDYYKKRKVRVLNGSHTNMVALGLCLGEKNVYDCIKNISINEFIRNTLDEIVPFVSEDSSDTKIFADNVIERFSNPYLDHQLSSILLGSIQKWRARLLPSFKDYYQAYGKIPTNITVGLSYLICLYQSAELSNGQYVVNLPCVKVILNDNVEYIRKLAEADDLRELLADASVWGEDMTKYVMLYKTLEDNINKIKMGESLI